MVELHRLHSEINAAGQHANTSLQDELQQGLLPVLDPRTLCPLFGIYRSESLRPSDKLVQCITPTGTLTSLLTKPWQPDFYRSVDQLVRQNNLQWIIEDGSALVNIGKDADAGSTLKSVQESGQ